MDFGYPQNLSPEILKLYITQEGVRSPFSSKVLQFFLHAMHAMFASWKHIFGSFSGFLPNPSDEASCNLSTFCEFV